MLVPALAGSTPALANANGSRLPAITLQHHVQIQYRRLLFDTDHTRYLARLQSERDKARLNNNYNHERLVRAHCTEMGA